MCSSDLFPSHDTLGDVNSARQKTIARIDQEIKKNNELWLSKNQVNYETEKAKQLEDTTYSTDAWTKVYSVAHSAQVDIISGNKAVEKSMNEVGKAKGYDEEAKKLQKLHTVLISSRDQYSKNTKEYKAYNRGAVMKAKILSGRVS